MQQNFGTRYESLKFTRCVLLSFVQGFAPYREFDLVPTKVCVSCAYDSAEEAGTSLSMQALQTPEIEFLAPISRILMSSVSQKFRKRVIGPGRLMKVGET